MVFQHLARWIHASIKDKIKKTFSGSPLYVEGEDDRKPTDPFWLELRIDGPVGRFVTKTQYMGEVQINLMLTVNKDEKYVHTLQDKAGLAMAVLNDCFAITKVGSPNTEIDDGSFVTVLQLKPDEDIDFSNFGQVDPTIRVQQASVEGHYRFQLEM